MDPTKRVENERARGLMRHLKKLCLTVCWMRIKSSTKCVQRDVHEAEVTIGELLRAGLDQLQAAPYAGHSTVGWARYNQRLSLHHSCAYIIARPTVP